MKRQMWTMALVVGAMALAGQGWAASSDTISVTVSLAEVVSVSLDTDSWNIGATTLGATVDGPTVTATNDGNVTEDFSISGTNGTGGWTLAAGPGANAFAVDVTFDTTTIDLSTSNQALAASVAVSGTAVFDLTYYAPTSDTYGGGVDQGFTITVTAAKSP